MQAYENIRQIEAEDWQEASFNWIKRRQLNYEGSYVN